MSSVFTLEREVSFVALPEGRTLAFERCGREDGPLVCVLGGISAGRHVCSSAFDPSPGFWEGLVGPGRAVDTDEVSVVGIDWLGGVGESSGPRTSGLGWDFPAVSARDQAEALARLLPVLGRERFDAIVGASFGGMVALSFAELHTAAVERLVVISAAHVSDPLASAWRTVQAQILDLGRQCGRERRAVEIARALALTTYRSRDDWSRRGGRAGVAAYLAARGDAFAQRFDAAAYARLSEAVDAHRVDPAAIRCDLTLVGVDTDLLVPLAALQELARAVAGPCRLHTLESAFGHDAFLKEIAQLSPIVAGALGRSGGAR